MGQNGMPGFACRPPCCTRHRYNQETSTCPGGFQTLPRPNACLKFFKYYLDWSQAKMTCEKLQAQLVRIESKFLDAEISAEIATDFRGYWIGLSDEQNEGDFRWSSGDMAKPIWTNWGLANPNNFLERQDCVVKGALGGGLWSDEDCGKLFRFICQIPPRETYIFVNSSLSTSTSLRGGDIYRMTCAAYFDGDFKIAFKRIIDGQLSFIKQPDPRIQLFKSDTDHQIVNGSCRRQERAYLQVVATINLDRSTWFCCLVTDLFVAECKEADELNVIAPPRELWLKAAVELDQPRHLNANCSAFVGMGGSLTWTLRSSILQRSWRVHLNGSVYYQEDFLSSWEFLYTVEDGSQIRHNETLGVKEVQIEFDDRKGPWIQSSIVAHVARLPWLRGARLTCLVDHNLKKSTQTILFHPPDEDDSEYIILKMVIGGVFVSLVLAATIYLVVKKG